MQIVKTVADVRQTINAWRTQKQRIAFVPTMGNLHIGHLKLVEAAKHQADKVVVSIFVNPTQFGIGEDFAAYPRTEQDDQHKLVEAQADLLFLPDVSEIYPDGNQTVVSVKALANIYCGASRPGHFDGVATVVNKFFNIVQPDEAFLGQKDYQQLLVIKAMVKDLHIPVKIQSVSTMRESDGLAMSSRNGYLTSEERMLAPKLYQALSVAKDEILIGKLSFDAIENKAIDWLKNVGFNPDYFTVCNAGNLLPAQSGQQNLVILAAAKLGRTRLIDNIPFNSKKQF